MNLITLAAIVTSTFTAPVDTLTGADFDLPIELSEKELFSLEDHGVIYAPWLLELPEYVNETLLEDMVDFARKFKGTRYRAGGKTPGGFDCSGFTGYVFKKFGMTIGASSSIQAKQGKPIDVAELRPGDLLFFSRGSKSNRVGHVGMVTEVDSITGRARFIHATTRNGITESSYPSDPYYRARFITARRIL
ncbi:MAG: C40 family peptidase [Muribaculaceae bacterium]|nr:C40 family peptidase [Muribaculaceae bacterium]